MGCSDNSRTTSMETGNDYPVYGGNKAGDRYSPLDQINLNNISGLQIVWTYNAAKDENAGDSNSGRGKEIQCQPIVVNGVLYGTTPKLNLFALDAKSGKEIWRFRPSTKQINVNRGVCYWENGNDQRILYTVGPNLYAINALNGKPVSDFGDSGIVDLHEGLSVGIDRDINSLSVRSTSPGVVYKNIYITGSSVAEDGSAAPGSIRAFDIVTGKLLWVFKTIPHPGEAGYETWPKNAFEEIGGANNWGGLVVDEKRGTVYFGTGSPSSDFYGGNRAGDNLFANCIISLNAKTGKLIWYYQTIHHDLWDRDIPAPPNLATINHEGRRVDVVVQATKDGLIYVLDREKGTPIFPVEERSVPIKGLPGEVPSPTQRYPKKPLPLSRQVFTENDISDISSQAYKYTKEQFEKYRADNKFTPPSENGTLMIGYSGGVEWGGGAVDPSGIYYQSSNQNPWVLRMVDTATRNRELRSLSRGNALYVENCAACHGQDRKGSGTEFPSLENVGQKYTVEQLQSIVKSGRGRMPSFQQVSEQDRTAIINFLLDQRAGRDVSRTTRALAIKSDTTKRTFGFAPAYVIKEWRKVFDPDGYPGIKPPWGLLNAVDLNTGDYLWRVPVGEFPELTKKGIPVTGTEIYGGPLVTAGGLVFIAGTRDEKIRALDRNTGKVVWEYQLPAGGFATPITYKVDGIQYIVIAAGGARGLKPGGYYVAFALKGK